MRVQIPFQEIGFSRQTKEFFFSSYWKQHISGANSFVWRKSVNLLLNSEEKYNIPMRLETVFRRTRYSVKQLLGLLGLNSSLPKAYGTLGFTAITVQTIDYFGLKIMFFVTIQQNLSENRSKMIFADNFSSQTVDSYQPILMSTRFLVCFAASSKMIRFYFTRLYLPIFVKSLAFSC